MVELDTIVHVHNKATTYEGSQVDIVSFELKRDPFLEAWSLIISQPPGIALVSQVMAGFTSQGASGQTFAVGLQWTPTDTILMCIVYIGIPRCLQVPIRHSAHRKYVAASLYAQRLISTLVPKDILFLTFSKEYVPCKHKLGDSKKDFFKRMVKTKQQGLRYKSTRAKKKNSGSSMLHYVHNAT